MSNTTGNNTRLPKGWEIKKLGEVCDFINGKAHEKIIDNKGKYIVINSKFISSDGKFIKKTSQQLQPLFEGDIAFVMSDVPNGKALAKCFLVDESDKYTLNQRIGLIRSDLFFKKYLFYHLNRHKYLLSFNNGENQTNLRKKDILNCPLIIPPIETQKRIVSLLDKAFEQIDRAKAHARQNLKNARELFESYLNRIFEEKGEDWGKKTFNELSTKIGDGLHGTPKYDENGEYYFINGNNLNDGVIEIKKNTKKINKEEYEKHKRELTKNTVLISINGTLGKVAFYNGEPIILGKSACYINFKKNVSKYYIKYLVKSPIFFKNMARLSTGATIKNFSLKSMRNYTLYLPPIETQKQIVQQLDRLQAETKKLEAVYQKKMDNLEELKKSVLEKAFNGEL